MPLEVPHGVPPWELQPRQPSLLAIPLTEFAMQLAMPRSLRQLHEWECGRMYAGEEAGKGGGGCEWEEHWAYLPAWLLAGAGLFDGRANWRPGEGCELQSLTDMLVASREWLLRRACCCHEDNSRCSHIRRYTFRHSVGCSTRKYRARMYISVPSFH